MKKNLYLIYFILFALFFNLGTASADKSGTVKIPIHNWTSQLVGAEIIGQLLKMAGEKIEYVPMNSQKVYKAMSDGDIDLVHEIWESAFGKSYEEAKSLGGIEEIRSYDAVSNQGWWYPNYVEQFCPGLPDWKALNKCYLSPTKILRPSNSLNRISVFSRSDSTLNSKGKGVFVTGPRKWNHHDKERIKALKMNFIPLHTLSAGGIWIELDKAIAQNKPIIIFNWSPNFIGEKYPGKFIKFPKYHPKCLTDQSWGINPESLYDCGTETNRYLKLAVNAEFNKNHPKGYELIKKINFSIFDFQQMSNYVDTDMLEVSDAAQKWLDKNKPKWSEWLK